MFRVNQTLTSTPSLAERAADWLESVMLKSQPALPVPASAPRIQGARSKPAKGYIPRRRRRLRRAMVGSNVNTTWY